jgi:hypothetical protein
MKRLTLIALVAISVSLPSVPVVASGSNSTSALTLAKIQHEIATFESDAAKGSTVDYSRDSQLVNQLANGVNAPKKACLQDWQATTAVPCTLGNRMGSSTIVLVGDSHAWMWFDAFARLASAKHWKVELFAKAACPFGEMNFTLEDSAAPPSINNHPYTSCTRWRESAFTAIRRAKPLLIIATEIVLQGKDAVPSETVADERSLHTFVSFVRARVRSHVVYLSDIPIANYNASRGESVSPGQCLIANALKVTTDPKDHGSNFSDNPNVCYRSYVIENANGDDQLISAARTTNVAVIDLRPYFCDTRTPSGLCPPVLGNVDPYYNSWHVDDTYAKLIASDFMSPTPLG